MEYVPVSSSTLDAVGFDPETQTLAVTFRNGTEYHYYNVTPSIFEGIRTASSPGQYFDLYVKKAGYSYARVR
jgi:KTSC domain